MAKQERTRKSAPQNRVKSFTSVAIEVVPALPLDSEESARFKAIIDSRERDTWTPADIATATHLAQVEIERDRCRATYLAEGQCIADHNGKAIVNPNFTVYNYLFAQANRVRRDLGLSASQRSISGHKQAKRNQQDSKIAEKVSSLSGLIARPK